MQEYPIGRFVSAVLQASTIIYFFIKSCKIPDKGAREALINLLFCVFLMMIPCSLDLAEFYIVIPKLPNIIGRWCFIFGMLMGYKAIIEFATDRKIPLKLFIKTRIFLICTILMTIMVFVMALNSKSISLTNSHYFENDWKFIIPYILYYTSMLYITINVFIVVFLDFKQHTDAYYMARHLIRLTGYTIVSISVFLANINLILFIFHANPYTHTINWIVQEIGRGFGFVLLTICSSMPQEPFSKITKPIVNQILRKQYLSLYYLCGQMNRIIPNIELPPKDFNIWRVLIAISQMREYFWSNIQYLKKIEPQEEAEYIIYCILYHKVFTTAGNYIPFGIPKEHQEILRYNFEVAKHLKRKQNKSFMMGGGDIYNEHPV